MTKTLRKIIICLFLTSVDAGDVWNSFTPGTSANSIAQGDASSSVSQSNGNNVFISRRMGPNNVENVYISVSNPNVKVDGDYFSCCGLICPKDSFTCEVNSVAIADDPKNLQTAAQCLDKSGKVLEQKVFTELNPYADTEPQYRRFARVNREGAIHTEDSSGTNTMNSRKLSKEEQEKLERDLAEQTKRTNQQVQEQQRQIEENLAEQTRRINSQLQGQKQQLEKQMEDLRKSMQNSFGNGFPFGNKSPFGNKFPFGNNFPFYNPYYPLRNYYNNDY